MKRLRFVQGFQRWKPGDVVEREDGVANLLLSRRFGGMPLVEEVRDVPVTAPVLEAAADRVSVRNKRK